MTGMARLAWFTPLPPVRSGIAAYNAELLPLLAPPHAIDVFTDPRPAGTEGDSGGDGNGTNGPTVFGAHDFLWKNDRAPYDLIVYQLGNAACHDFMWPHLARYPGLVVLHDGQLNHERSRALLSRGRVDEYRAEFRYNHPGAPEHLEELFISALGGSFYYLFPMRRWVVLTARLVAVHSAGLAREITETEPGVEIETIRHGLIDPVTPEAARAAAGLRVRHGIPEDSVLFAAFGLVTPEKRISAVLGALARLVSEGVNAHLLLAGGTTAYFDAIGEARALSLAGRVHVAGYVADEDLPAYALSADACLCLRWPTSRETSGTWIRAAAAGRPTVVTDLAHTTDIETVDPRTWTARGQGRPIAVGIDLLDEAESLYLAMRRLAGDAKLRHQLGEHARQHWLSNHTMSCAVADYGRAIERALGRPAPRVRDLPRHLESDGTALVREILSGSSVETELFGVPPSRKA
jgi:glycosyltransferase involved in cell wall biosynthesis